MLNKAKDYQIAVDKIDFEDLIKDFKVLNIDNFISYLKEVWKDLSQRSDDKLKGITKVTFSKYYDLPGIISERLFAVFDKNKNEFIDLVEFTEGMTILFSESFDKMEKFIFSFYDFDKDGIISKEDVRTVLSYIPLNTRSKVSSGIRLKFEQYSTTKIREDYKDRVESQDELYSLLEKCFNGIEKMDFTCFSNVVEKVSSDILLFILIFLLERKPFSKKTLEEFNIGKSPNNNKLKLSPSVNINRLIASPNMMSKFSPSVTISKSPSMLKRYSSENDSKSLLNKFSLNKASDSQSILNKYAGGSGQNTKEEEFKDMDENAGSRNIPVNRKNRNNLKNIEEMPNKSLNITVTSKTQYTDLPITGALKQSKKTLLDMKLEDSGQQKKDLVDYDSDDDIQDVKYEGYLYKMTQSKKLNKLWFKLIGKDLYYYKSNEDKIHKGMHNLSGVFLKEELKHKIENESYFCFSVVYPKKSRIYFTDNEEDKKNWIKCIRKVTGYENLTDIYDIKEKLGNGKFGLVRLGIHKQSQRKVAVKVMNKKDMTNQDLELVKTEIEILKICQHPNIIRLYDVFENLEYIYIIMEYCSGGDLFSYLEKRGFKLSEQRASSIIHKLSAAVFYLHSYGICHRDLKPENILMTDNTEEADIRLLDFGLSKIIGPGEVCNEPFGTLSYVAPEILLEKPYSKAVDLWSIGIITYLLLCGSLPFDDEKSEREIARQTIHDQVPYHSSTWKKLSPDAKIFVDNLLSKDPKKRMIIKDILEHVWILNQTKNKLAEIRRISKDKNVSLFKMYTSVDEKDK